MSSIIINTSSEKDLEILQNIGIQTFTETFAEDNTEEAMKKYLEESFTTEKIKSELNNPDSFFYIAWEEDNPVGYLKVNSGKAQTELQDETSLEIERIYVKKSHHGKKVGQLLYNQALETAKQLGKSYLWLGVWEENLRALNFYRKNGFVEFDKHIFRLGEEEQTDLMMKKVLD
ncbi:ribosomal protein S18 acetylase RimI-like enzyme [Chryseobacterium bernardetii]|jgi:ribosomal protein S18 acetylase RimI-like enzyme|uniref:Spermine/spermidine N-acetyltransferase n=3 Tax=Chryseobacterium TaxID=59732 RepID=A0A543EJ07_9FLAO|nr:MULTISPECIES: GNAT family N-acetyltransferase [Chryseobacterium]MDR6370008.1 ribosomal protein S18 acetylase RimI-like enzyme [Chryseobacterium vietnamense]MDR6440749.1 ribosomal protein S18 acetylase RimI-like enzyme [Chryseobacterium bernardetii]MDR6458039.1 ribosomal protein S18 acetylase RimI-like enzyme [Chryseobacterium vietnamense]MDR6486747.1 ribosomal protein S18 acetylase RimI-like enzyme [Chryseobacterium vietnamense]TQM21570.1 spermine/spermidine N-acetyltransferase [Chryseobact